MSHDLMDLLDRTAPGPSRPADVDRIRARGRQIRLRRRVASGGSALAVAAVAWVVLGQLPADVAPRIDQRPDVAAPPSATAPASDTPAVTGTPSPAATMPEPSGEVLADPTPGEPAPGVDAGPAASACALQAGETARITFRPELPDPRCVAVTPGQQVAFDHLAFGPEGRGSGPTITASLGGYRVRLDPEEEVVLDLPVSTYLSPGVHTISSEFGPARGEVWVLDAPAQSAGEQGVLDALVTFAQDPTDTTFARLPLAGTVRLGLHENLVGPVPAGELRDPAAWRLGRDGTGTGSDTASALQALQGVERGSLVSLAGPHPSCGRPAPALPDELRGLRRLSVQPEPSPGGGCEGWFSVDLFVDDDQRVVAIVLTI